MSTEQRLFSNVAPLSSEAHGGWSLKRKAGYGVARNLSSVSLVLREFPEAVREFPIVFAREGDEVMPQAMLGLKKGENLFVREDGRWDGSYVPAALRQYPFVIGRVKDSDQALLSIDQDYAGFNSDGDGQALFDRLGAPSELVVKAQEFAKQIADSAAMTQRFCRTLQDLGILTPMGISLTTPDGKKREIKGFQTVNRDKLKALSGESVRALLTSNMMELIFLHLQSLNNLRSLASRIPKGQGAVDLPDLDTPDPQ